MNGLEHYRKAEQLLSETENQDLSSEQPDSRIARARLHIELAKLAVDHRFDEDPDDLQGLQGYTF